MPYWATAAGLNYTIRKGWTIQASGRAQGESPALSPSTGLIKNPADGLNEASDGRVFIRTPEYVVLNLGTTYRWNWGKIEQSLNLTVKNLLNRYYTQSGNATAYVGDGRGVYVGYSIHH